VGWRAAGKAGGLRRASWPATGNPAGPRRAPAGLSKDSPGYIRAMSTLLWILAVVLVVAGIVSIVRGQLLWGIVLIIVGLLVGPGGVSIFT
jgi:hypothetical protein